MKQPGHPRNVPRWALCLLALAGCGLGPLALPTAHAWLGATATAGGWRAALAVLTLGSLYYVLVRTPVDLATDIRDWRCRGRYDSQREQLRIVNGRLGWAPSVLILWTNAELLIVMLAILAFVVGGLEGELTAGLHGWSWLTTLLGWVGICCAGFSLSERNSQPVFPLPYRWLGLARNCTAQEAKDVRWAWSRKSVGVRRMR